MSMHTLQLMVGEVLANSIDLLRYANMGMSFHIRCVNRISKQRPNPEQSDTESSSESSDDEDEDDSDDPDGAKAMIAQSRKDAGDKARAERKAKRKAEKEEASQMAEERRKKVVKLNKLDSISGGRATPTRSSSHRDITCFRCGKKGHTQRDCPQASQTRSNYR